MTSAQSFPDTDTFIVGDTDTTRKIALVVGGNSSASYLTTTLQTTASTTNVTLSLPSTDDGILLMRRQSDGAIVVNAIAEGSTLSSNVDNSGHLLQLNWDQPSVSSNNNRRGAMVFDTYAGGAGGFSTTTAKGSPISAGDAVMNMTINGGVGVNAAFVSEAARLSWTVVGLAGASNQFVRARQDFFLRQFASGPERIVLTLDGFYNFVLPIVGQRIRIHQGPNCFSGDVRLVGGMAVVANSRVTSTTNVVLTGQDVGTSGSWGTLAVQSITTNVGFTIVSSDPTDTSLVYWLIF